MNRQGRILVVDDLENWRKQLVESLQREGFHADSASTSEQVIKRLNETFYHLLLLDVRLVDSEPTNREGITLLDELDKRGLGDATKVIILSAYGTKEQMRTAFAKYKVVDFLSKDDFTRQAFLEKVREVFKKGVNINLSLQIHWQQLSGFEQVVTGLKVGGTRVQAGTPLQNQLAAELEDLLCRLFYQAKSILIRPLTQGCSGMGVLRVQPFYTTGGGNDIVIKFGDFHDIEREYQNFKKNVQPFLGGGRNTSVLDLRRTSHLGGIVYSLLGTINDQLQDFGAFYDRNDVSKIKAILDRLFRDTCSVWYANRSLLQPLNLAANYQRMLGCTPEMLEKIVTEQLPAVRLTQSLLFTNLKPKRLFTNPLQKISGLSLNRSTYLCITHGDFNQHNLLVDSTGHVWMIDFQETGQGHILRDLATLDSVVRFQLLTAEKATLRERLYIEQILCVVERFSQIEQLPNSLSTRNQALVKAYATVVHLRTLARRLVDHNPNGDMSEYYIALLYNALNTLQFSSLSQTQREHALLCASLLVDKLGLTSN